MKLLSGQRMLGISMLANTTTFLIEIQINYWLSVIWNKCFYFLKSLQFEHWSTHRTTWYMKRRASLRSILWFPIPQLPDKTFWKFSDFLSKNGLKSILTIIVMGNKQWFTSFCFQSWFPENEMLPDKTFWQKIQVCIICWWSAALWWCVLMSTGLYWTIFNHKSRLWW